MKLSRSELNLAFESTKILNLRYLGAEDLEAALLGDDGVQQVEVQEEVLP